MRHSRSLESNIAQALLEIPGPCSLLELLRAIIGDEAMRHFTYPPPDRRYSLVNFSSFAFKARVKLSTCVKIAQSGSRATWR